jgi:hypothetical protein
VTLAEQANAVETREDFVAFVGALKADFDADGAQWQNTDLASFLDAMAAWTQDMDGYYRHTGQKLSDVPSWRVLADILVGASMYE